MLIDAALSHLLPELRTVTAPTLWLLDDNAMAAMECVGSCPELLLVTHRFDLYRKAVNQGLLCVFSDFNPADYPVKRFDKIVYRIAKEKPQVHFLLNQAAALLTDEGELIISGYKNEGIKTYGDKLHKNLCATGKIKKHNRVYSGRFTKLDSTRSLDDQDYSTVRIVRPKKDNQQTFYSKPGVFGWNKIDRGTELLLAQARLMFARQETRNRTVLDLGCGYGWIFMALDQYGFAAITATDNNAAALSCAKANAAALTTPVTLVAGDGADTIAETFDFVLCNPPFHQGFSHSRDLTKKFLLALKKTIKPGGSGLVVVNEFIAIERSLEEYSLKYNVLEKKDGFKVVALREPG